MKYFISDVAGYVGNAVYKAVRSGEEPAEVVGTVSGKYIPRGVTATAKLNSPEAAALALEADAIVICLDQHPEESQRIMDALRDLPREAVTAEPEEEGEEESAPKGKTLIAVSSLMTWAKCGKPPSEEGMWTEADYKKRKPSHRYADIKTAETAVMRMKREGLRTVVVGAGVMYGGGEHALHPLFKRAWLCEDAVLPIPSIGKRLGRNRVPMIHVADVGKIAKAVAEGGAEGKSYVLAVDGGSATLNQIVKAVAKVLGNGAAERTTPEEAEAMLLEGDEGRAWAQLQMNLRVDKESTSVGDLGIEWTAEEGFLSVARSVAKDYIRARDLRPVKVSVMGPPGVKHGDFASAIGAKYYLPTVTRESALADAKAAGGTLARTIEACTAKVPEVSTTLMGRVMAWALSRPQLRNRGYVLADYPRTYEEAVASMTLDAEAEEEEAGVEIPLEFVEGEDGEEEAAAAEEGEGEEEEVEVDVEAANAPVEEDEDAPRPINPVVAPTAVVSLTAADESLLAAAQAASGEEGAPSEAEFTAALTAWREANTEDGPRSTAVFFEKRVDVELLEVDASADVSAAVDGPVAAYIDAAGAAFNFHPTPQELAEAEAAAAAKASAAKQAEDAAEAERVAAEEAEAARVSEENDARMQAVAQQEAELLEARSEPLRRYLVAHVIPKLTEGLVEVTKVKPENPVDFLAEYLFQAATTEGEGAVEL
jgi:adenylate kinase